jgi:hypothetical protein
MSAKNQAERETARRQTPSSTFENSSLGDGDNSLRGEVTMQRDVSREEFDRLGAPTRGHPSADSQRPTEEVDAPGGRPLAGRPAPSSKSGWLHS